MTDTSNSKTSTWRNSGTDSRSTHKRQPSNHRFPSIEDDEDDTAQEAFSSASTIVPREPSPPPKPKNVPVSWLTLPHKLQLSLLGLSRVFDFLQIASLQAYMFYQLKSFDEGLPDAVISQQAGVLQGAFTAAQFATAIPWGRVADARWGGRKRVLMVGLVGTGVSCLGVGFSRTFMSAVVWRTFGGAINGTVGIIRTMIAETVKEKKFQSRAFLILPMGFNIANLFGPVLGGLLSDPVKAYPSLFGPGGTFGGEDGAQWLVRYPYALPGILNAVFLFLNALGVWLALEETLQSRKGKRDLGLEVGQRLGRLVSRRPWGHEYTLVGEQSARTDVETIAAEQQKPMIPKQRVSGQILPFYRIFTKNVIFTLLAQALFDFQMGAFNNLWLLFLSTPRRDPNSPASETGIFHFNGGLGMPPATVGLATSIIGIIGLPLQLAAYPPVHARFGTTLCYRYSLLLFPLAYALAPYISLMPSSSSAPSPSSGFFVWTGITIVLFLQVAARTFALPASIILLNNCSPHPSVLGTIHGVGQTVSSAFRTIGPVVAGRWYGQGLEQDMVGLSWWAVAGMSVLGALVSWGVREGSGHEIFLPGEIEAAEEMELEVAERREREEGEGARH